MLFNIQRLTDVMAKLRSYWKKKKKPVRRRECTSGQAAKWRYEEQMRFFKIAFRKER
jgi:hypothetical protein